MKKVPSVPSCLVPICQSLPSPNREPLSLHPFVLPLSCYYRRDQVRFLNVIMVGFRSLSPMDLFLVRPLCCDVMKLLMMTRVMMMQKI